MSTPQHEPTAEEITATLQPGHPIRDELDRRAAEPRIPIRTNRGDAVLLIVSAFEPHDPKLRAVRRSQCRLALRALGVTTEEIAYVMQGAS